MAAAGGGAQQQGGDNSLGPFWIIVGLFALGWGIWYFAHEQIAWLVLRVRLVEAQFISLFIGGDGSRLANAIRATASASGTSFAQLAEYSTQVGNFLRYPVVGILGFLAIVMYFSHANMRYKKTYSMKTLVNEEKVSWPQITPIAKLNLVAMDIDKGPWAMALSPMQFAKKNKLLQEERILPSEEDSFGQPIRTVVTVRREEAQQVFALQVGRYWTGPENLNKHTKALFAVFAARLGQDRDGATKLLLQMAASTSTGKLDFSGADELLEKHKNHKTVRKIMESHAFVLTVMASMLLAARSDGVLASADFLWLKPIDRPLWFMLNTVGRQTPFSEAAGPFAHWVAERRVYRKLSVPMVEEAVNALELAIKDIIYVPDDEPEEG